MRKGRRILERHAVGDQLECPLRSACVLGEGAGPEREHVAEYAVTWFEPGDGRADGLNDAGDIDPDGVVPWGANADDQAGEGGSRTEAIEVGPIDGGGFDSDERLVASRDRHVDVLDADDLGWTVAIPDGGLHDSLLLARSEPCPLIGPRRSSASNPASHPGPDSG